MKIFTQLFFAFLFVAFAIPNQAQELVSSEHVGNRTKGQLLSTFGNNPFILNGVDMYKITYTTPDVHGVPDTASGLLLVPDDLSKIYPLLCYQHGTVGSKEDVPSNLQGGFQLALLLAGTGYVTSAADYLGLGESRGFHPYVHAATEASAAIDMLFAVREFAEQNDVFINDQLFMTGYSQGGHAALAAHRSVQQDYADDFTVTASAPMSGPYYISVAQKDFTLGEEEFFYPGFVPYVALGYQTAYQNIYTELNDFFKPDFVPLVEQFRDGLIDLNFLNNSLITKLQTDYGEVVPRHMIQDDMLDQILNNPTHPVNIALADNDLVNWGPQAPTRLVYCENDDQVSHLNSVFGEAIMLANGAPLLAKLNIDPSMDHIGCVSPAIQWTIIFFSGFQEIEDANATIEDDRLFIGIYPNPASDFLYIKDLPGDGELRLIDLTGRIQLSQRMRLGNNEVEISNLQNGIYVVEIVSDGKIGRGKTVIRK